MMLFPYFTLLLLGVISPSTIASNSKTPLPTHRLSVLHRSPPPSQTKAPLSHRNRPTSLDEIQLDKARVEKKYGQGNVEEAERDEIEQEERDFFFQLLTHSNSGVPDIYEDLVSEVTRIIPTLYSSHGSVTYYPDPPSFQRPSAAVIRSINHFPELERNATFAGVFDPYSLPAFHFEEIEEEGTWYEEVLREGRKLQAAEFEFEFDFVRDEGEPDATLRVTEANSAKIGEEVIFVPLESHPWWQIDSVSVHSSLLDFATDSPSLAIVDPHSSHITLSLSEASSLMSLIPGASPLPNDKGLYQYPCTSSIPLIVEIHGMEIRLPPEDLNLGVVDADRGMCVAAIVGSNETKGRTILGTPFLNAVHTIFDRGHGGGRVGFAIKS